MHPSNSSTTRESSDDLQELMLARRRKEASPQLTAFAYLAFGLCGGVIGTAISLAVAMGISRPRYYARAVTHTHIIRPVLESWYILGPILAAGFVIGAGLAIRFLLRERGESSEYHRLLDERDKRLEKEVRDLSEPFFGSHSEGAAPAEKPPAAIRIDPPRG